MSSPNAGLANVLKPKKLKKELKDGSQKTRLSKQMANKDNLTSGTPEVAKDGQETMKQKPKVQARKELSFPETASQEEPKLPKANIPASETSARTRPELAALLSSEKDTRSKEFPDSFLSLHEQRKALIEKMGKASKEHKRTASAPVLPSLDLSSALATLMKTTCNSPAFPNVPLMPPAGFPMFPQQLIGFPMDSRNDVYFNQYTNFMSNYLAMVIIISRLIYSIVYLSFTVARTKYIGKSF